jgi:hypothetical protein
MCIEIISVRAYNQTAIVLLSTVSIVNLCIRCVRAGRFAESGATISVSSSCATPCHARTDCSSCLQQPANDCVWCEDTATCFSFAVYTRCQYDSSNSRYTVKKCTMILVQNVMKLSFPCNFTNFSFLDVCINF